MTFLYAFLATVFPSRLPCQSTPKKAKKKEKCPQLFRSAGRGSGKWRNNAFPFSAREKKTVQSPDLHRKKVPFPFVVLAHFPFVLAFGQVLHIYTYTTTLVYREEEGEGKEEEETISQREKREGEEEKKVEWGGGRM